MSMQLPLYPKKEAASAAVRLRARRARYASAIAELREELVAVEDAWTEAFAVTDQRDATRARLAQMATENRNRNRRI